MDTFFLIHITNKANLTKTTYNKMEKLSSSMSILCLLTLTIMSCQNDKKEHSENTHSHGTAKTVSNIAVPKGEKQLPPSNDIHAQVAVETCNCLSPMLEKAEEADRLMKENQQSKVGQILEDVEKLRPKAEICSAEIKAKYSNLTSTRDQKKILEALNKYCPESAALLRKTLSMKISQ
jgi:uncharacterized membrane-anchored protein